jgi:hypothetical protein
MGRGGGMNKLRRDSFYRKLILQNYDEYYGVRQCEKRCYALVKIVTPIRILGGKFYLPSSSAIVPAAGDNLWKIGSDDEVLSRVMQSLRDCKKEEKQYNKKNEKKNVGCPDGCQSFSSSGMSLRVSVKNENENEIIHNKDEQQQKQIAKTKTNNNKSSDNSATVADSLCQRYYKQRNIYERVEERQNVTKKDEGFDAVTPTTNQDNNSNQKKEEQKKRRKKMNIYLNEVNGHMLNISNRDAGVCGLYHDLLVNHSSEFTIKHDGDGDDEEDGADDDEMMSFVWDNIISELHRKYGDTNFILCPHSSKVVDVQQQLQEQDNNNFVDVTFRTIICIIRALSDIEYIASERFHRQIRQQPLQQQVNSNNITNSCDATTGTSFSISGGRASTLSIQNSTKTVPENQDPVHSLNSKSRHHKRSQKRPLNDTESEENTNEASSSESLPPLKQQQQGRRITTRFSTGSNPKQKKQRIYNNDATTTPTLDSFSSILDCSSPTSSSRPHPSSSWCKKVTTQRKSALESKDQRETSDGDEQQLRTDNNSSWEALSDVPQTSDMFEQVDQSRIELSQKQHPPRVIIQPDDYENEDEDDLIF